MSLCCRHSPCRWDQWQPHLPHPHWHKSPGVRLDRRPGGGGGPGDDGLWRPQKNSWLCGPCSNVTSSQSLRKCVWPTET